MTDEQEKVAAIQSLLDNAGWARWMQPVLMARMKQTMDALALQRSEDDDIKRGWFQALRWILNLPAQEIESFKASEREASKNDDTAREDEYRSYFGYRSPYKRAPEPGDTKVADDTTSAA